MPRRKFIIVVAFAVCLLFVADAFSLGLKQESSIPLKKKDRISGSMRGNFLVYGKPNITVYNPRLKPLFSKRLKNNVKPVISPNGQFVGLVTYNDHSPTTLKAIKFELYQPNGKFVWKLRKPVATTFQFADNGNIFGVEGVIGISPAQIHVYDRYGDRLNIVRVDAFHGLIPSPDGLKFVVDEANHGMEVFDSLANSIAVLPPALKCVIDKDNRYIGTFAKGVFHLYQDEKEVQAIKSQEVAIEDMAINVEKGILVLMSKRRIETYDLISGRRIWDYQVQNQQESFTSLDMSPNGEFIVCGLDISRGADVPKKKRHLEGYAYLIPTDGKTMYRHRLVYNSWGVGFPKAFFSKSGASIYILTKDKITKYRII